MNIISPPPNDATTVDSVSALVPWMQQRAAQLDDAAAFPTEELAELREAGVLALPLPIDQDLSPHDVRTRADSLANVTGHRSDGATLRSDASWRPISMRAI